MKLKLTPQSIIYGSSTLFIWIHAIIVPGSSFLLLAFMTCTLFTLYLFKNPVLRFIRYPLEFVLFISWAVKIFFYFFVNLVGYQFNIFEIQDFILAFTFFGSIISFIISLKKDFFSRGVRTNGY